MAKRKRKKRTHVRADESADPSAPKVPKSFVMRSGEVGKAVSALVKDVRRVMEPNTATRLRERKRNRLKDFVAVAGPLGVMHFLIFTRTDAGTNLRIARTPRGPTLCFRVARYALAKDVLSELQRPKSPGAEFHTAPLLVLNNFTGEDKHIKLMTTMFQNMFPAINPKTMQLAEARRLVLLNYNSDTKTIDFRHYSIGVKPTGLSKSVRQLASNEIPDLHKYNDISEFILREGIVSESEAESGVESTVTLPQKYIGRNNRPNEQRAIKLTEIGPRMDLVLVKIQSALCDGEVLFHEYIHKTPEEVREMEHKHERRKQLANMRRKEQERNVERKRAEKEAHRLATGGKPKNVEVKANNEDEIYDESENEDDDEEDEVAGGDMDNDLADEFSDGADDDDAAYEESSSTSSEQDNNVFDGKRPTKRRIKG